MITSLGDISWMTVAFAAATLALILGFKRFAPRVPGAIIAVALLIVCRRSPTRPRMEWPS
jgi:MFS superfamily sulfate permease-like transporter